MGKLALKNIKRNLRQYALYIGATVFSIMIYFTFATLKYSENISGLAESSSQIKGIMSISQFVLIVFVSIFILYSNTFFIKKRKKEIGLYSLLGVRKRTIGFMLFIENMVIGLISLIIGVLFGFVFSQLFLLILLKMIGLALNISFTFSLTALMNTSIIFFVIFLVTSLIGYRIIYRYRLIELFKASQKSDRKPKANSFIAILGLIMMGVAYSFALADLWDSFIWATFGLATPLIIVGLTVMATYLLFNHILIKYLTYLRSYTAWSWKGLNMLTSAQLLHRIRANARTLTIIATLSATTITAGGAIFGLYYSTEKNVSSFMPFAFMWEGESYDIESDELTDNISFELKDVVVEGEKHNQAYNVINESTFKSLATVLEWEFPDLYDQESVFLINPFYDEEFVEKEEYFTIEDQKFKLQKLYKQSIFNVDLLPGETVVLTDQQYNELDLQVDRYNAVQVNDFKKEQSLSNDLEEALSTEKFSSKVSEYYGMLQQSGVLLFVGSFLGIVFLLAMGSIIFFKMMTEAEEDKPLYEILHKIGVNDREMKRTIRHQMLFVFLGPLLIGIAHAAIALTAFSNLLMTNIVIPVILWMIGYTIIYIIFYFVTAKGFYKIIQEGE
ncbi:MAG TPA: ABC transporter permease [Pseudogracilibacillus sp.]|nr:ABC transporter permease [Pseudogracilibacillus sp.]